MSRKQAEQLAETLLPPAFGRQVAQAALRAQRVACVVLDLGLEYRELETALEVLLRQQTEAVDNGGDLHVAVTQACGLEVVREVLLGAAELADQVTSCMADRQDLEAMRRHAQAYRQDFGEPVLFGSLDEALRFAEHKP